MNRKSKEDNMKKVTSFVVLGVLVMALSSMAQPALSKKYEFSMAASFWSIKYDEDSASTTILNVPLRFGIFIYKGLELEPEFVLTIPDSIKATAILASLNVAYNFISQGKIVPFVLLGAGYGNGEQTLDFGNDLEMGIFALNAGAGLKILMGDSAAFRVEYRFVRYSGKRTYSYTYYGYTESWTEDYGRTDHRIFAGLSLFF
jgi:hypothetical protein